MTARPNGSPRVLPCLVLGVGLLLFAALPPRVTEAQVSLEVDRACDYYGELERKALYLFDPDSTASGYVRELNRNRTPESFELRAADVQVAAAALADDKRFVVYDQYSFAQLDSATGNKWKALAVLAHQIAHHELGHQLDDEPATRAREELEADEFSAIAIRRAGGSQSDATSALRSGREVSPNYPSVRDRLAAIERAWRSGDAERTEPHPPVDPAPVPSQQFTSSFSEDVPSFHWPPPFPSARTEIPRSHLTERTPLARLADVAATLEMALELAGHGTRSYYAVPGGFALASQLERINSDGTPASEPDRWSADLGSRRVFSLGSYFKALFTSASGRFRVIVFVLTTEPLTHSKAPIDYRVAKDWLWHGNSRLPPSTGIAEYTDDYACTALIYEFSVTGRQEHEQVQLEDPSVLGARTHLEKAGIWSNLGR